MTAVTWDGEDATWIRITYADITCTAIAGDHCATCRFSVNSGWGRMRCHRWPPTRWTWWTDRPIWPPVSEYNWCGEHRKEEATDGPVKV